MRIRCVAGFHFVEFAQENAVFLGLWIMHNVCYIHFRAAESPTPFDRSSLDRNARLIDVIATAESRLDDDHGPADVALTLITSRAASTDWPGHLPDGTVGTL